MRLGTMLADVVRSLFRHHATRLYPFERQAPPARLRGTVRWDPARCTGCRMCVMDCPADALELFTLDKATHRFVMRYDAARCTFCAQCVESCNYGCLSLSGDDWELAGTDRSAFITHSGAPDDVEQVLAGAAEAGARQPKRG